MSGMRSRAALALLALLALLTTAAPAVAQELCPCPPPPPPPPAFTGSLGLGAALTSGNTDTFNLNFTLGLKYDPKTKNVVKFDATYLRGETDGALQLDRLSAVLRDEYSFTPRLFAYGELGYLRDRFKGIEYLFAPAAGVGYKVLDTDTLKLAFDAGFGGAFESDYVDYPASSETVSSDSAAIRAGEAFAWKISPSATLTQAFTALWKTEDTSDAIYHFEIALSASITKWSEVKVAFTDDYKNKPPDPKLKKNDTALVAAIVFKM